MISALEFARQFQAPHIPGQRSIDKADVEARDRENRAQALEQAAQLFEALIRHSRDGYVQLTSVSGQLRSLARDQ